MARPTGVTILAILSFLGGVLTILGGVGSFFIGAVGAGAAPALGGPLAIFGAFAGVILLVLGVLYLINGFGLLKLMAWARQLTMVLVVIGLLFGIWGLFRAFMPFSFLGILWQCIGIAIDVWILMYMLKPHVKQAFGIA